MPIEILAILLATGAAIGFISGLLGIGGGIIMTPVQYWLYTSAGIAPDIAILMSFATSLAVVLPTSASGVWQHQRRGSIHWRAAIFMGIITAVCSFGGALIASRLPGPALRTGFGILALIIAVRLLFLKVTDDKSRIRENIWLWAALAVPVGFITGILGIGGGIIVVPLLVLVLRFNTRLAAGTSLAMILFTSTGGIIGYFVSGMSAAGLPAHTLGYIYWPGWIALSAASIGLAQVGAIVSHKVPVRLLNYIFMALLVYIGLDMLGFFDWVAGLI